MKSLLENKWVRYAIAIAIGALVFGLFTYTSSSAFARRGSDVFLRTRYLLLIGFFSSLLTVIALHIMGVIVKKDTQRRLRKRRVAKWVATDFLLLLLVGWAVNTQYMVLYGNKGLGIGGGIAHGTLGIASMSKTADERFYIFRIEPSQKRNWRWGRPYIYIGPTDPHMHSASSAARNITTPYFVNIRAPFWVLTLINLVVIALLWRWDRMPPPGHCLSCSYNLTGNTSGMCPECGEEI